MHTGHRCVVVFVPVRMCVCVLVLEYEDTH
jgi:hypothetical protein